MPADTDLAARIEATMARRAKAASVDSISVDKDVLDALYAAWRQLDAMRCETCKHWEWGATWGMCALGDSTEGGAKVPESRAHAQDSELWHAWLATRNDFGCIQYDPKEGTDAD